MRKPIPFCSFGGYRLLCSHWWWDLLDYVVGVDRNRYRELPEYAQWWHWLDVGVPGWLRDVRTYWHRARYGWAPKDTWSLDDYLNGVLAGSLAHLAEHTHGTPCGYPMRGDEAAAIVADGTWEEMVTDHVRWEADLRRWAHAFSEEPNDVDIFDKPDYVRHNAEEKRRRDAIHQALREMEPWWDALWD
jgi:hypothetical protein